MFSARDFELYKQENRIYNFNMKRLGDLREIRVTFRVKGKY